MSDDYANFYNSRVSLGATLMDSHNPDWFLGTNTETLDMSDPQLCILGQNFGFYSDGLFQLGISSVSGWTYGFNLQSSDFFTDDESEEWALLEIAWINAITDRIAATIY